jgi:hypothetical protein
MTTRTPFLSITQIDADPDFPGFTIAGEADGFAGRTEVWVTRADLAHFLDTLDALDQTLRGDARLTAGWVTDGVSAQTEDADVDLTVRHDGHSGRLAVSAVLREARGEVGRRHVVRLSFVLPEPNALTRFRVALRSIAVSQSAETAVLSPEPSVARV